MKTRPIGYHVMCGLADRRVIAPTARERRIVARTVLEKCRGSRLLCFGAPDTHLHLELAEDRRTCGQVARRVEITLTRRLRLDVGFDAAYPKPIRSQRHLYAAFDYILRQQPRHGLEWDPYHESSSLSDLLGLRVLGQWTADHVRGLLPRVSRASLLGYLGIDELHEADGPPEQIVAAVLAATGLPDLGPRSPGACGALTAAVAVLGRGCPQARIADLLQVCTKTVQRLARRPAEPRLVRAIRLQLGLRRAIAEAATGAFVSRQSGPRPLAGATAARRARAS